MEAIKNLAIVFWPLIAMAIYVVVEQLFRRK